MKIAMLGLGKMGLNMATRLLRAGHEIVGHDLNQEALKKIKILGGSEAATLQDLAQQLQSPRIAWLMLPAGTPTDEAIESLSHIFEDGDIIIDGGNTFYKDDLRHSALLKQKGIHHIDVGTSGGVWGLERGYCMMIGGEKAAVDFCDPIFKALAPGKATADPTPGREQMVGTCEEGYLHCGPSGAGHFVKMVHNGIEYAVMQSYAEGLDILKTVNAPEIPEQRRYDLNLADITELWRRGSILGSFLLDMMAMGLHKSPDLKEFSGFVQDSGEGRWTVQAALEQASPAEVLSASLYVRFRSRQEHTFAEKVLSMTRFQFGGHLEGLEPSALKTQE